MHVKKNGSYVTVIRRKEKIERKERRQEQGEERKKGEDSAWKSSGFPVTASSPSILYMVL